MVETFIILCLTSLACGTIGNLLVLKNESMIADALSHSVLLGIVLGFFISQDLNSPLLIIGATIFGILTVIFIDWLMQSSKINHDGATGLIFPLLFSIAVILISTFAKNVHLDIDMVLMGEILFASLNRTQFLGLELPVSLIQTSIILIVNSLFIGLTYQRLKLYLFDTTQAILSGIPMTHYKLITMLLVSLTTVIAFNAVGSITVITFFVAPSMTALFFSNSFKKLLLLSTLFALLNSALGLIIAIYFDLNISGSTAFISLLMLLLITKYRHFSSIKI